MKNKKKNRSKKNYKNRNSNNNRKQNLNKNSVSSKNNRNNNNSNVKNESKNNKSNSSNTNSKTKLGVNSNANKKIQDSKNKLDKDNKNENLENKLQNDKKIVEKKTVKNSEIQKENVIRINKEKEENSKSKKSGKTIKVWVLLLVLFIFLVLFFILLFVCNRFSNKIQNNISIENINISKLTADEAKVKVESEYNTVTNESLKFSYQDKLYEIKLEDIDFNLKIDNSINQAIEYGRNSNIAIALKDFYWVKFGNNKDIPLEYTYSKDKLNSKLEEFQKDFYQEVQQYTYKTEDNKLQITNGIKGIRIDLDRIENDLTESIHNKSFVEPIEIPLIIDEPEKIDVDKIHQEVFVEVKDAYYTTDPFEIHDEIIGIDFDVDALKNIIESEPEKTEYVVDLIITEPAIKVDNLDLYNDELGRCSTYYVNNPNRTNNLRLAANKINGYILMPGETFSYNEVVGERTYSAGYRNAAIYVNGEVEDGLAGGICQISSTLYNAVVQADLEIVERSNHARVPSYLPAGKDATVYWGSKDFIFKNNRSFPVRISISVEGGYATAIINGKLTDNEYDISIETSVVSRYNGYLVVNAYKVYRQNGVVINREWLSTDSYKI